MNEPFRPMRLSEWDTPRTTNAVRAQQLPDCNCDPEVRIDFDENGDVIFRFDHAEGCVER